MVSGWSKKIAPSALGLEAGPRIVETVAQTEEGQPHHPNQQSVIVIVVSSCSNMNMNIFNPFSGSNNKNDGNNRTEAGGSPSLRDAAAAAAAGAATAAEMVVVTQNEFAATTSTRNPTNTDPQTKKRGPPTPQKDCEKTGKKSKKKKKEEEKKTCANCAQPIKVDGTTRKYCSSECTKQFQNNMKKEKREDKRRKKWEEKEKMETPTGGLETAQTLLRNIEKFLEYSNSEEDTKKKGGKMKEPPQSIKQLLENFGGVPEIVYCKDKKEKILATAGKLLPYTGAVMIRGMVEEKDCQALYLHSQIMQLEPDANKYRTISGRYGEISLEHDEKKNHENNPLIKTALKNTLDRLESMVVHGFGKKPCETGLMYIHTPAESKHQQPLHADSMIQGNAKAILYLSPDPMIPTDYVPYTKLEGEPLDNSLDVLQPSPGVPAKKKAGKTRSAKKGEAPQEAAPVFQVDSAKLVERFGPVYETSDRESVKIYQWRQSVLKPEKGKSEKRMAEQGDCLLFCGDFIHGGPSNVGGAERHSLFVSFLSMEKVKMTLGLLDSQMHPGSYAEMTCARRTDHFDRLCIKHLLANNTDPGEYEFYIDTWWQVDKEVEAMAKMDAKSGKKWTKEQKQKKMDARIQELKRKIRKMKEEGLQQEDFDKTQVVDCGY